MAVKCTIKINAKVVNFGSQRPAKAKLSDYIALPGTQSIAPYALKGLELEMLFHHMNPVKSFSRIPAAKNLNLNLTEEMSFSSCLQKYLTRVI